MSFHTPIRMHSESPEVSVVIPAKDEADYLPATIESVATQETDRPYEAIVVDGDSDDRTPEIAREWDLPVVHQTEGGIGRGRHLGAEPADGDVLAFVDADTTLDPGYLGEMLSFLDGEELVAASARCRMPGVRPTLMQATINRLFPRLGRPILPGFNLVVRADAYEAAGGFPDVPNEDTAFSRRLAEYGDTAYHPEVLVETSGRRFDRQGLTGTAYHYVKLDVGRLRADS